MSAAQLIPIENIYYLFCYAWNRFEEAQGNSGWRESQPGSSKLAGAGDA